jgi:hypothetical protein
MLCANESIPHRFLGRPEFAVKPASMVIAEMDEAKRKISNDSPPPLDTGKTLFPTPR